MKKPPYASRAAFVFLSAIFLIIADGAFLIKIVRVGVSNEERQCFALAPALTLPFVDF